MDCQNKNCKYYKKKEKDYRFAGFYMVGSGGYCKRGYCEKQFRRKRGRRGMKPASFKEQNSLFVAEGCDNLPACKQYNEQFQTDEVISCWEFTDDELVQILKDVKAGKRPQIFLSIIGGQPPVALFMRSGNHARNN